ncbi:hypothetical protein [Blastopirellula marina]|uniref:Cytochrome c domain-containing protein n=1 Tax=Blastopirellula marina TaxID=124 RepID=A0A2S8GCV7_9BACT|nr:hypothetical protein [Blastopirellula marina]PQO42253.1 hypothetical protein C5Y93_28330 [Blastopirellula marina]
MKKVLLCLVAAVAAFSISAQPAYAVKVFGVMFAEKYNLEEPTTDAEKALAAKVEEAKCALCHGPKSKKVRNEYGIALGKLVDKKQFSPKRAKDEPEAVQKELFAAFDKVAKEKSKSGETFGEKIAAGEMPAAEGTDEKVED